MRRVVVCLATVVALAGCGGDEADDTPASTQEPTIEVETSAPLPELSASPEASEEEPEETPPAADLGALEASVTAYSDAFLNGRAPEAYDMFSARCKEAVTLSFFTGIVTAAQSQYGAALPIQSFDANMSGDIALVTYTYDVPALDQASEPWVLEDGTWRLDDCG